MAPSVVKCPICQAQIAWEDNPHRPFCSEVCRLIDLGAWAKGKYRIPGRKVGDDGQKKEGEDGETPS